MIKLAELVGRFGGRVRGDADAEIENVASLASAGPRDIAFVADRRHHDALDRTAAGVVILPASDLSRYRGTAWVVDNPRLCFARVATLLKPTRPPAGGTHRTAAIDATARVASSAFIGAHAVIEAQATIEDEVLIGAGCYIGSGARVGAGTRLGPHVFIGEDCTLGRRCIVHPGAVIGSDGFGFAHDGEQWVKIPQLGRVRIGDEVEIGANTTIDRGALDDTIIGDGVKLDNLIQIAHNVDVGEHSAMAAHVGIAGSTRLGKGCTIGGRAAVMDHLQIADGVHITAGSLVTSSIAKSGTYSSSLRTERAAKWNRNLLRFMQLDEMNKRLRQIEQRLERLAAREGR